MATNLIQIKRTSVSGRAANSTTLTNPGELALNMTDGIMYSTNGTSVFEIGANNTNQRVSGTLTVNAISANGGVGTAGQVLSSNGTAAYWATSSTLNAQQTVYRYTLAANTTVITGADDTAATLSYVAGLENVFINGVRQISGVDYNTTNATAITLVDAALTGEVVQVVAWTGSIESTNVNAQFVWTNTHSFSNTVTLKAISANGSLGTAGQVLHSNGTSTYWAADDNSGTVTSIATANGLTGGTITTTGTLGVATGSTLTVNSTGIHVNSTLSIASVNATSHTVGTNFIANSTQTTFGTPVLFNNQQQLRFQTVNTSAYAYFTQQNDDNFVFYTSNTTYGARAVLAIFANSITSNLQTLVPLQPSAGIVANSSLGSAGQVLKTTGSNIYWDTAGVISPTLMVGNTSGAADATLHIKSVQGGNGRFLQFSPLGNSVNALAIMASSNSSGGEQWWSVGSQNDDTFKIQKGVGFGGAGVSISNTGAITSADLAAAFGYKGIPQNQQTSAYTLVMSDQGKHIYATAANFAITIPANSTTAFPIGTAITIVVEDQLHTITGAVGVTLVLAGTGAATTGTRTLAQGAVATILKVGTDRWYISGAGIT